MLVKEIKNTWKSYTLDRGQTHMLYDPEPMSGSYTPHKYLCDIKKVNRGWYQIINKDKSCGIFCMVNKISDLKKQIQEYTESLPYNCEFYNSQYREGYFEEMVINNYMHELGFDSHHLYFKMGTGFTLKRKNIYRGDRGEICISISGLGVYDEINEDVEIRLSTGKYSWIETKCKRNCEEIIEKVDGLLKPLLLTNCTSDFKLQNELKVTDIELTMNELVGFSTKSNDFKEELISSLEKTLNELKK